MQIRTHIATVVFLFLAAAVAQSNSAQAGCKVGTSSDSSQDTCIGSGALSSNTTGWGNSAFGNAALFSNTTGYGNSGFGNGVLSTTTTGDYNTSVGYDALYFNSTGGYNTGIGSYALFNSTTGNRNTAVGAAALVTNTTGYKNTADGAGALYSNTTGAQNTASGSGALYYGTTGSNNAALGYKAGSLLTTGSNNIMIGANVTGTPSTDSTIMIGVQGTQTQTFLAGVSGTTITGAATVVINSSGQLGVLASSGRYKEDIHPMGDASNKLMELRPVTFRYKKPDEAGRKPLQYGLIAEDVATVMPELVVYNKDGTPETVAYQFLPSLLLNEYQKQAKELAAEKAVRLATEARLDAVEAELAAIKSALATLAAAKPQHAQLVSAP